MKKYLCLLLLCVIFILVASSCNGITDINIVSDEKTETTPNDDDFIYLTENTTKNLISISIPLNDKFNEETIDFIKIFIENRISASFDQKFNLALSKDDISDEKLEYSNCYMDIDSEISFISDEAVSIVFNGLFNKKGTAHPIHCFFSLNFDPATYKILSFSDNYVINEDLYNAFVEIAEKDLVNRCNGKWPDEWKGFSEEICSEEDFLKGMQNGEFDYFYTSKGIGISYPVAFSLGDHIEVIIPHSNLKKFEIGDGSMS